MVLTETVCFDYIEFGIFRSKAKLKFGQFRAILLLGPSKSGRSLWVKKWISFFSTGVTEEEEKEEKSESFVLIV